MSVLGGNAGQLESCPGLSCYLSQTQPQQDVKTKPCPGVWHLHTHSQGFIKTLCASATIIHLYLPNRHDITRSEGGGGCTGEDAGGSGKEQGWKKRGQVTKDNGGRWRTGNIFTQFQMTSVFSKQLPTNIVTCCNVRSPSNNLYMLGTFHLLTTTFHSEFNHCGKWPTCKQNSGKKGEENILFKIFCSSVSGLKIFLQISPFVCPLHHQPPKPAVEQSSLDVCGTDPCIASYFQMYWIRFTLSMSDFLRGSFAFQRSTCFFPPSSVTSRFNL